MNSGQANQPTDKELKAYQRTLVKLVPPKIRAQIQELTIEEIWQEMTEEERKKAPPQVLVPILELLGAKHSKS